MSADPAKDAVVMDACCMKRILSPATDERRVFDAITTACGRFVYDEKLSREYRHAIRAEGGSPDDLQRRLDALPSNKKAPCQASALDPARVKPKALTALEKGDDAHLLVAAVVRSAKFIISSDSVVLESASLVMTAHEIVVCDADGFLKARSEAGFGSSPKD